MTDTPPRIYFLDGVRTFIIIGVVVLHGAVIYMNFDPVAFAVRDSQQSLVFTLIAMLLEPTQLTGLFFIAAYFALPSIGKRGSMSFLREKTLRIGLPWLAGVILIIPLLEYMTAQSSLGWWEYCTSYYWAHEYHQGAYWYLGVLMLFFLLLAMVCAFFPGLSSRPSGITHPTWKMLAAFWLVNSLGMFAVAVCWKDAGHFQIFGHLLAFMPDRIQMYAAYFIMGLVAWRHRWFTPGGFSPPMAPWLLLTVVSMTLYAFCRALSEDARSVETLVSILHLQRYQHQLQAALQMATLMKWMNSVWFNAASLSALMATCAVFQRFFNAPGPLLRSLSANSFGIYFIHSAILFPFAYFLTGYTLPLAIKAPGVIGVSLVLSWAVSVFVLKKAPLLRRIF
ncbi:MAG: hypothetical protein JWR15_4531 [Prosthecobacter sp.]|nr:hypothetical protein [Prosthecobacter sp.]